MNPVMPLLVLLGALLLALPALLAGRWFEAVCRFLLACSLALLAQKIWWHLHPPAE